MPLMIPAIDRIRSAANPSRKLRTIGMPPATAASNPICTPFASAAWNSSVPWDASNALLAVTTCFFAAIASSTKDLAGSMPPISSIRTRISGSSRMSSTRVEVSTFSRETPRSRSRSRSAIRFSLTCLPDLLSSQAASSRRILATPVPTVPNPASPTCSASKVSLLTVQLFYKTCRMPLAACWILCSFSTRAKRTYPSPNSPNPTPGETATFASLSRSLVNSRDPIF